jgi:hypothetical protein
MTGNQRGEACCDALEGLVDQQRGWDPWADIPAPEDIDPIRTDCTAGK